jgi:hypothetical protein
MEKAKPIYEITTVHSVERGTALRLNECVIFSAPPANPLVAAESAYYRATGCRRFYSSICLPAMLHMIKLAVGVRDAAHLSELQQARAKSNPPLRHQTRNRPKRADEITGGGSMYWVIGGAVLVRQRITCIIPDQWDEGSACTGLVLDPALIRVAARVMKPFQGWRYLKPADAPADIDADGQAPGIETLPAQMRAALAALALL